MKHQRRHHKVTLASAFADLPPPQKALSQWTQQQTKETYKADWTARWRKKKS